MSDTIVKKPEPKKATIEPKKVVPKNRPATWLEIQNVKKNLRPDDSKKT